MQTLHRAVALHHAIRLSAPRTGRVVLAGIITALSVALIAVPAEAGPLQSVGLAAYRIPDRYLSLDTGSYSFGYGFPPAYGFDTADHNVQCYIAPGEDSSPFACGVNKHAWKPKGRGCKSSKYAGILGFANAVYGSGRPSGTCSKYPIVPRQRTSGSAAITARQTNTVLSSGSTIRYLGVACTASGSGRSATISCVVMRTKHGFEVSYSRMDRF